MSIPGIPPTVEDEKSKSIVAFLFGAGASVEAGVPDTISLIKQFRDKDADPKVGAFLDQLARWAQQQERTVDIELVLETLQRLADWNEDPLSGFTEKPVMVEGIDPHRLLAQLRDFIKEKVLVDAGQIDYLKPLRGLVDSHRPLHVYSANYDTAIEVFCAEHKLKYRDGFDEAWNPDVFDEGNVDLRLFKLHGSVTWYRSNRGRFLKIPVLLKESSVELVTKEQAEALMLYPAQKFEYVEPLFELLLETKRRLADCQVLIVVGYSFRDEHIRRLLWDVARERPEEFYVVLISPNAREIYRNRLRLYEDGKTASSLDRRVICLPFSFKNVLPALQIDILPAVQASRTSLKEAWKEEHRGAKPRWESALLSASRCGDYETVRTILPTALAQLDLSSRFDIIVLGLFHAVANRDLECGKYFWDELRNTLQAIINNLVIEMARAPNLGLYITAIRWENSNFPFDSIVKYKLSYLGEEITKRVRWLKDGTKSPHLDAVGEILDNVRSATDIWARGGSVEVDKYIAARRDVISLDLKELLERQTQPGPVTQDVEQIVKNAERAVIQKVFARRDPIWTMHGT